MLPIPLSVPSHMIDHYLLCGLIYLQDWIEAKAADAVGPEE